MRKIIDLIVKHKGFIFYGIFGVLSTLINWGVYFLCYQIIHIPNVPSTIIAWILSVSVAFITNKVWAFESKSFEKKLFLREAITFFSSRLATGALDVLIMFITVDVMKWNSILWKMISNVIVIIINYIFMKFVVFKKGKDESR